MKPQSRCLDAFTILICLGVSVTMLSHSLSSIIAHQEIKGELKATQGIIHQIDMENKWNIIWANGGPIPKTFERTKSIEITTTYLHVDRKGKKTTRFQKIPVVF